MNDVLRRSLVFSTFAVAIVFIGFLQSWNVALGIFNLCLISATRPAITPPTIQDKIIGKPNPPRNPDAAGSKASILSTAGAPIKFSKISTTMIISGKSIFL